MCSALVFSRVFSDVFTQRSEHVLTQRVHFCLRVFRHSLAHVCDRCMSQEGYRNYDFTTTNKQTKTLIHLREPGPEVAQLTLANWRLIGARKEKRCVKPLDSPVVCFPLDLRTELVTLGERPAHGLRITVAALLEGGHSSAEPTGHCAAVFSVWTGPIAPYHRDSP